MDDLEEHSGELVEVVLAELRLDLGLHIFVPRKRASETATGRERAAEESLMTQKLRKLPLLRSATMCKHSDFRRPSIVCSTVFASPGVPSIERATRAFR